MLAVKPYKGQVLNSVPSNFKESPSDGKLPNQNLKLKYAFGYRCFDSKNMA